MFLSADKRSIMIITQLYAPIQADVDFRSHSVQNIVQRTKGARFSPVMVH